MRSDVIKGIPMMLQSITNDDLVFDTPKQKPIHATICFNTTFSTLTVEQLL